MFGAAVAGGGVNAIAGGGTLITFPTLLWLGRNPVLANASNTLGLLPGTVVGAIGFRAELARSRAWVALLVVPSLVGGIAGAVLLLRTPTSTFEAIVPWLILAATLLLALQEPLSARLRRHEAIRLPPAWKALAAAINGIAIVWFIASGAILWRDALVMMAGAALGGWASSRLAYRLGRKAVRRAVVAIGLAMAVALALRLR